MNRQIIYKIVPQEIWDTAKANGEFVGASIDLQDGFIHFSATDQVRETAEKHFANQHNLLLVSVDAESLGNELKWEVSRGGAEFPHLYGSLKFSSVVESNPLERDSEGKFVFPDEIA